LPCGRDKLAAVAALLRETRSIPIVFVDVTDPVTSGFVADRIQLFAKELVELQPDVILASTTPGATIQPTLDPDVAAVKPTEILELLLECRAQVALNTGSTSQYTEPAHPIRLLGACHPRPRDRRAADQSDELPPLHPIPHRRSRNGDRIPVATPSHAVPGKCCIATQRILVEARSALSILKREALLRLTANVAR
jgi:hypothetical protein